jgi:phosphatidylglycerol:prolipoprotein diacylglycerol transferase
MRSTLFTIQFDVKLGNVPVFGEGWLLAVWGVLLVAWLWRSWRRDRFATVTVVSAIGWLAAGLAIHEVPRLLPQGLPLYGFGLMLFLGFVTATWFGNYRLQKHGYDGELAWDIAMWGFFAGIAGARLFYVVQYRDRYFIPGKSFGEVLRSLVMLPDGGLVFYGGLLAGAAGFFAVCWKRRVHPLAVADLILPSLFTGMMFGRLGCLMHGCCYGDPSDLPWAISFPAESVPWQVQVARGYIEADAPRSLPLHPTQIYDSISGLLLMLLMLTYYPYRRRTGEVLALAWLTYPVSRFVVELLRGDELGQFGTTFTISQWVSVGMFASGLVYLVWLGRRTPAAARVAQPVTAA